MATTAVRLERTTDGAAWDALLDSLTPEPAFHRWTWLDLQARTNGFLIERLLVLDGSTPVGVLPVPRRSKRSIEGVDAPFPYLGPIVPAEHLAATVTALRRWQRQQGMVISHLEFGPTLPASALEVLNAAGADAHHDTTIVMDVAHGSMETVRAGYSSLRRRDIRRALRDGCTVRESLPGEITSLLPEVLHEAFGAHGKPSPYHPSIGATIEEWAVGRDDVGLYTALVEDEPAGVQVVLGAGDYAMAWAGACLRRFRDANPNVLLYDRLFEWAVDKGYPIIDLCGQVDEGVLKYKLAFGGVMQPYTVARTNLIPQPLLSAAARARRSLHR